MSVCICRGLPYRMCPVHGIDRGARPEPSVTVRGLTALHPLFPYALPAPSWVADRRRPDTPWDCGIPGHSGCTVVACRWETLAEVPVEVCCCGTPRPPHPRGAGRCKR